MPSLEIDWNRLPHRAKFDRVFERMTGLGRVLVAYSGGVDSSLLLKIGTLALAKDCIGVIARSETLTPEEYELASAQAHDHGCQLHEVSYSELAIENYAANPTNRCYFCKHELFSRIQALAIELGARAVIEGSNADDMGDWRPGLAAVRELEVISPLREADLSKQEIRDLARALGLSSWDKPSNPCLSSRIAYGVEIDRRKLEQVADGERFLRQRGFRQVRVRHRGDHASVEVAPAELPRLEDAQLRAELIAHLLGLGFEKVEIDERGYRTGSLNEGLTG